MRALTRAQEQTRARLPALLHSPALPGLRRQANPQPHRHRQWEKYRVCVNSNVALSYTREAKGA